jgi:AcrR family transcriptional regulator
MRIAKKKGELRAEGLRERKHELVRSAIWDAAVDLFARKGFDETTVEEIAEAAGISRRTFFRYFGSKSDLMGQGIVTYGTMLTEAIGKSPSGIPLLEVMRRTAQEVVTRAAAHPRMRDVMKIARTNPAAREAQFKRLPEVQERVAAAYTPRCGKGRGDGLKPRLLAAMTMALLDVTFQQWYEREREEIGQTAEQVFAVVRQLAMQ